MKLCRMVMTFFCLLMIALGTSKGVAADELKPPAWSVGDWWIVESQVYDTGEIVAGSKPSWGTKQKWHFRVEAQEMIADHPYFVVSVRPGEKNPCPYWFRYWFRVSDMYVGRYELHHPDATETGIRNIGPSVVRKNFAPDETVPFFTSTFPALPITVPLFTDNKQEFLSKDDVSSISPVPSDYTRMEFEVIQEVKNIDERIVSKKMAPRLRLLEINKILEGSKLVTIKTTSGLQEQQYWNHKLPWCVYGERNENSSTTRRYTLISFGNE